MNEIEMKNKILLLEAFIKLLEKRVIDLEAIIKELEKGRTSRWILRTE